MKNLIYIIPLLLFLNAGPGRGGGGGGHGGGGGGGGGRGGGGAPHPNSISRTPSMTRNYTPNESRARPVNQGHVNRPQVANRPQATPQQKAQLKGQLQSNFQKQNQRGINTRSQLNQKYPNRKNWFGNDFWRSHNYYPDYWNNGYNGWGWSNWANANTWLGWGDDSSPVYYSDSYGIDVTPDMSSQFSYPQEPQNNYVDSSPIQTNQLSSDWLPLGVFALVNNSTDQEPYLFFQLALNKNGTLGGSYFNEATNQIYPINGVADRPSQRAVWQISNVGQEYPIFETGLYNLTLKETPVIVHFDANTTKNWTLIRG